MDDNQTEATKKRRKMRTWLLAGGLTAVLASIVTSWLVLSATHSDDAPLAGTLPPNIVNTVSFPLYYPSQPPNGFALVKDSPAIIDNDVVSFSFTYDQDRELIVTEQPRPPIIEEVQKIVEFTTPAGKAHIANLNGRITGFIVTNKTLIIISSREKVDTEQLRGFMATLSVL